MAQLAPTGTVCKSKRQCLKIIICPMALGELQINCIVAFKVCPQRGQRGLSTPDQTCNSLCICVSLIKTGESAMASTQREPEQKKEKKKKKTVQRRNQSSLSHWPTWLWLCELEKSVSVFYFLTASSFPHSRVRTCIKATERHRLYKSLTVKAAFHL